MRYRLLFITCDRFVPNAHPDEEGVGFAPLFSKRAQKALDTGTK
jgi:hypothetical protein